ncbi:MAG: transglycosylase SLT domain-containing protein [Candidatus Nitrotoga sp.]
MKLNKLFVFGFIGYFAPVVLVAEGALAEMVMGAAPQAEISVLHSGKVFEKPVAGGPVLESIFFADNSEFTSDLAAELAAPPVHAVPLAQSAIFNNPATGGLPSVNLSQILSDSSIPKSKSKSGAADVWHRIRAGYDLKDFKSPLIARHEKWYASRPDYIQRMTERGRLYLYFIVEEIERRGMPMEIALLPMIESAFYPGAYSTARASGIWQFIPSTGKKFGMEQNWWYDGRRDVIGATNGALDYLQSLHDMFGDWQLALAAYNCGEGKVKRAIAKNRALKRATDYASLSLPKETRHYLPKLYAIKNIITHPEQYDLTLPAVPNEPYFSVVTTDQHIDIELAAELADISLEEFRALNPAHNRPVILQEHAEVILLPVEKVETFRNNLASHSLPLVTWHAYKSKKGEHLQQLADRFDMPLDELRSINGLPRYATFSSGQALLMPLNGAEAQNKFEAFNTHLKPYDLLLANAIHHVVRRGDTMSGIAQRYRVGLSKLKRWNGGVKILRPGQRIYVVQPNTVRARTG